MKRHEFTAQELAMRSLLIVKRMANDNAHFLLVEAAGVLMDRFGVSRPSAYRLARLATDILCIPYDGDPERDARRGDRMAGGRVNHRACVRDAA